MASVSCWIFLISYLYQNWIWKVWHTASLLVVLARSILASPDVQNRFLAHVGGLGGHVGPGEVVWPVDNVQHSKHCRKHNPEMDIILVTCVQSDERQKGMPYIIHFLYQQCHYLAITSICLAPFPPWRPAIGASTEVTNPFPVAARVLPRVGKSWANTSLGASCGTDLKSLIRWG